MKADDELRRPFCLHSRGGLLLQVASCSEAQAVELSRRAFHFEAPFSAPNLQILKRLDLAYASVDTLVRLLHPIERPSCIFLADRRTFDDSEMTLLAIESSVGEPLRPGETTADDFTFTMRCIPEVIHLIEYNITSGRLFLEDYARGLEEGGVFRGFAPK